MRAVTSSVAKDMNLVVVADAREVGSSTGLATERRVSPVVFALDRLFPRRGNAPYATAERLVVLIIVRAMSLDGSTGAFNCFLSYPTIAKWAGVSVASVKRALQKHGDGPAPLFYRSKTGETRGHRHACYRFTLVTHPEKFAAARDVARAAHREQVDRAMRDLQPDRIALQRQREDFGGTLTEAEYRLRLAVLESAARRRMPARAFVKRPSRILSPCLHRDLDHGFDPITTGEKPAARRVCGDGVAERGPTLTADGYED